MGAYCDASLAVSEKYAEKVVSALQDAGIDDFRTGEPKPDGSIEISWETENRHYGFFDDIMGTLKNAGVPESGYMLRYSFLEGEPDDAEQFYGRFHGDAAWTPVIRVRANGNPFENLAEALAAYYGKDEIAGWFKAAKMPESRSAPKGGAPK